MSTKNTERGRGRPPIYPIASTKVGGSFWANTYAANLQACIYSFMRRHEKDWSFTVTAETRGGKRGVRATRVS